MITFEASTASWTWVMIKPRHGLEQKNEFCSSFSRPFFANMWFSTKPFSWTLEAKLKTDARRKVEVIGKESIGELMNMKLLYANFTRERDFGDKDCFTAN